MVGDQGEQVGGEEEGEGEDSTEKEGAVGRTEEGAVGRIEEGAVGRIEEGEGGATIGAAVVLTGHPMWPMKGTSPRSRILDWSFP